MGKDQISVAFLSVVPETDEFTHMGGYSPAGNLAVWGWPRHYTIQASA